MGELSPYYWTCTVNKQQRTFQKSSNNFPTIYVSALQGSDVLKLHEFSSNCFIRNNEGSFSSFAFLSLFCGKNKIEKCVLISSFSHRSLLSQLK